jgi:hypothetical protein
VTMITDNGGTHHVRGGSMKMMSKGYLVEKVSLVASELHIGVH